MKIKFDPNTPMSVITLLTSLQYGMYDWRGTFFVDNKKTFFYIFLLPFKPVIKVLYDSKNNCRNCAIDLIKLALGEEVDPPYDLYFLNEELVEEFFKAIREVYRL